MIVGPVVPPILLSLPCPTKKHKWAIHFPETKDPSSINHRDRICVIKCMIRQYEPSDVFTPEDVLEDHYVMIDDLPCWVFVIDDIVYTPAYGLDMWKEKLEARYDHEVAPGISEYDYYVMSLQSPVLLPEFLAGIVQTKIDAGLFQPERGYD